MVIKQLCVGMACLVVQIYAGHFSYSQDPDKFLTTEVKKYTAKPRTGNFQGLEIGGAFYSKEIVSDEFGDYRFLASLYLLLGGLFCTVIHPVCRLQVINESFAKTGSHVFYLKRKKKQQNVKSDLLPPEKYQSYAKAVSLQDARIAADTTNLSFLDKKDCVTS